MTEPSGAGATISMDSWAMAQPPRRPFPHRFLISTVEWKSLADRITRWCCNRMGVFGHLDTTVTANSETEPTQQSRKSPCNPLDFHLMSTELLLAASIAWQS